MSVRRIERQLVRLGFPSQAARIVGRSGDTDGLGWEPVAGSDAFGIGDQPGPQDVAGEVRDAVRPDTLVKDAELFEVPQVSQASLDGLLHGLGDQAGVPLPTACTVRPGFRVAEAQLPRLRKSEQAECLAVRDAGAVAVALGDQLKARIEVPDELVVRACPVTGILLEDQEGVDEQRRIDIEDHIEPVVPARHLQVKVLGKQQGTSPW